MSAGILIRGGRVIDPAQGFDAVGDVLVQDGRIAAVKAGRLSAPGGTPVLNAEGLVVAPGFIDLHSHLREPGFEHKETIATGTRAAARGGFTTICCMPNTSPAIDTRATLEFVLAKARREGVVRVLPVAAVTRERAGKALVEMGELAEAGAVAFSDDGSPVAEGAIMRSALSFTTMLSLPVIDHCEDPALAGGVMHEGRISSRLGLRGVPAAAEETMVARDIMLAELTGGRVHIAHLSTAGSVALVSRAKERGLHVTAEATPHHLTLTDEAVAIVNNRREPGLGWAYDTNAKVNPPLRSREHVEAVVQGLRDGVIDAIATDHAPHATEDKLCEFDRAASGISGFETALASVLTLVHEKRMDLPALIERLTAGPARVLESGRAPAERLGIGTLRPGAPGDLVLFDPDREWTVDVQAFASRGKNSPLHGRRLKGKVIATIYGGAVVHQEQNGSATP